VVVSLPKEQYGPTVTWFAGLVDEVDCYIFQVGGSAIRREVG